MKRTLNARQLMAVLLVLIMALGMLPAAASAEDVVISQLVIPDDLYPFPVTGQEIPEVFAEETGYTISGVWSVNTADGSKTVESGNGNKFLPGIRYNIELTFAAQEGYVFAEDTTVKVEGNDVDVIFVDSKTVQFSLSFNKTEPEPGSSAAVSFKVVNGSWDGSNSEPITVEVPLTGGKGTLSADEVPAGMVPNEGYEDGAWDTEPDTDEDGITGDVTYTYSFTKKAQEAGDILINEANFPDANFRAFVETLPGGEDGKFTPDEIKAITDIDCHEREISDLTGIEHFTALTNLNCSQNQLKRLDVRSNSKLTSLYCSINQLTSLNVSSNSKLTGLYCTSNSLACLDVSYNTALAELECSCNQLTSLDVSNNTELTYLSCGFNQLMSLDLSENTALAYADCGANKRILKNGTPLAELSGFDTAKASEISGGNFDGGTVNFDSGSEEIGYFYDCGRGYKERFFILSIDCHALIKFGVANGTWDGFNTKPKYVKIQLTDGRGTLPADKVPTGMKPYAGYEGGAWDSEPDTSENGIRIGVLYEYTYTFRKTAAPVADILINEANFPDAVFRAYVETLPGAGDGKFTPDEIKAVTDIDCYKRGISDLTGIEHFTSLDSLNCSNNQLTSLDVSKNIALRHLYCNNNQLESLDMSNNNAIRLLHCRNNKLTDLNMSQNTALTSLVCDNNQLESLDVSQNTALTDLECGFNQLTSLDVSSNNKLAELYCNGNKRILKDGTALTELPSFDASKVLEVFDGNFDGGYVNFDSDSTEIDYVYNCGSDHVVIFKILKADGSASVVFKVENGSWDGTDSEPITVEVLMNGGKGTLPADKVPTGMVPDKGYEGGAWDIKPDTSENGITGDVTYTYTFTKKAQETKYTYTLSFDANGAAGTVPTDMTETAAAESHSFTVPGPGGLSKENHSFAGWNTKADGTGKSYAEGSSLELKKDSPGAVLYAQWTENVPVPETKYTYTLSFDANGAVGTVPADMTKTTTEESHSFTVPGPGGLSMANHSFAGWNTKADGSGTAYAEDSSLELKKDSPDAVLYAQWMYIPIDPDSGIKGVSWVTASSEDICPVIGGHPFVPQITGVKVDGGAPAYFTNDKSNGDWYVNTGKIWEMKWEMMSDEDTFTEGKSYQYRCQIRIDESGYAFKDPLEVFLNGVSCAVAGFNEDGSNLRVVNDEGFCRADWYSPEYTLRNEEPGIGIKIVSCVSASAENICPVIGGHPFVPLFTDVKATGNAPACFISDESNGDWYVNTGKGWEMMSDEETFKDGESYQYRCQIRINEPGYKFPDPLGVFVNDVFCPVSGLNDEGNCLRIVNDEGFCRADWYSPEYTPVKEEPEIKNIQVVKKWSDPEEAHDPVTVHLVEIDYDLETSKNIASVELGEGNNWSGSFAVKTDPECECEYTVTEDSVAGYTCEVTGSAEAGFTVTNTKASGAEYTYTLSFDANGAAGTVPTDMTETTTEESHSFTVPGPGGLKMENHEFIGWKDEKTNLIYNEGNKITLDKDTLSARLTAMWQSLPLVKFIAPDADKDTVPEDMYAYRNKEGKLEIAIPVKTPARAGFEFSHYELSPAREMPVTARSGGTGAYPVVCHPGDKVLLKDEVPADVYWLTAVWKEIEPYTVTLSYDANGGKSNPAADSMTITEGMAEFTVTKLQPVRDGYEFVSWNTEADGKGDTFKPGDKIELEGDATLYAQWKKAEKPEKPVPPSGKPGVPKTGDGSSPMLYVLLMLISVSGAVLMFRRRHN